MKRKSILMNPTRNLESDCINTIRILSAEAVQKANSGHPGMPMGTAPMAYVLWTHHMKHNPQNPQWFDRDRFVLSAGHGSILLYTLLFLTGYEVSLEDIKSFRQWGSKTPGHPEFGHTPGVETTTGPLGQGFANAVGMAIAEKHLAARFNKPDCQIINHNIYGICGDGDLMEGISSEAASLAGHLKLGNLIFLYDDNHISIDGSTDITFTEDRAKRFESYGWQVIKVDDGNDIKAIDNALNVAKAEKNKPSLIAVRTQIGFGSPNKQNSSKAHGAPLGEDELKLTKLNLGWSSEEPFDVPSNVLNKFRSVKETGIKAQENWDKQWDLYQKTYPSESKQLMQFISGNLPAGWDNNLPFQDPNLKGEATRKSSGRMIQFVAEKISNLIGGSADLAESNMTFIGKGDFLEPGKYENRNIAWGVREHAMASASNGIALHGGLIPFSATFMVFSDYCRPAIRLASLMKIRQIFVFTHDGIGVGEDGPTHQPIEHYMALRGIPGLIFMRPCDANETVYAWKAALERKDGPTILSLTRQNLPILDRTQYSSAEGLLKGGYVLADSPDKAQPQIILIATGSEVQYALYAYQKLISEGVACRVVSLPCWELFEAQPIEYRNEVLPPTVTRRLAIETGISLGWERYVGLSGKVIGLDHFGASAPGDVLAKEYGFTGENVLKVAKELLS